MLLQQVPPAPVAELAGFLRRPDDVGEQHRGQAAVEIRCSLHRHRVDQPVADTVHDQRPGLDGRQDRPQIELRRPAQRGRRRARRRRQPLPPPVPGQEPGVLGARRREHWHQAGLAPSLLDGGGKCLNHRGAGNYGPAAPAYLDRHRTENQSSDTLGVGGREHHGDGRSLAPHHERGTAGPGGVHDRHDVVRPLLQRGHPGDPVGKPGAALAEQDQPAHRRQPVQEPGELGKLPHHFKMRHPTRDEHQVKPGCGTGYLIGDINVPGPGEPCLRHFGHHESPHPPSSKPPHRGSDRDDSRRLGQPGRSRSKRCLNPVTCPVDHGRPSSRQCGTRGRPAESADLKAVPRHCRSRDERNGQPQSPHRQQPRTTSTQQRAPKPADTGLLASADDAPACEMPVGRRPLLSPAARRSLTNQRPGII